MNTVPFDQLGPGRQSGRLAENFMQLSLEERRQILARQAEQMKSYYERTKDERTEWQAGDFINHGW